MELKDLSNKRIDAEPSSQNKPCPKERGKGSQDITLSALEEDLLTLLQGQLLYGLQIMDAANSASFGRRTLKAGSLYTTLHRMEEKGLVSARWGEEEEGRSGGARRKYYETTDLGQEVLQETQDYRQRLSSCTLTASEDSVKQAQTSSSQ